LSTRPEIIKRRDVMKCPRFVPLVFAAAGISQAAVATITVKELDGVTTQNVPITFGHVFRDGDVHKSIGE
jgi:hypothetical protein